VTSVKTESVVELGDRAGCPFCAARLERRPSLGQRIIILNGFRAGMVGTVTCVDLDSRYRVGTFLVKEDGDQTNSEQIINPKLDLFAPLASIESVAQWLPPLSMGEAAALDEIVVSVCSCFAEFEYDKWHRDTFYRLIDYCWQKRLPLSDDEVWAILAAHGMPKKFEKDARRSYVEGTELLIYSHGRKPIKKKRIPPLSSPCKSIIQAGRTKALP
jgi:hypothetical protein